MFSELRKVIPKHLLYLEVKDHTIRTKAWLAEQEERVSESVLTRMLCLVELNIDLETLFERNSEAHTQAFDDSLQIKCFSIHSACH